MSLDSQVKSLNSTFKSNLGSFLSRVSKQTSTENGSIDIEALLTDFDKVISNQKELSELIQKIKFHQKISKELEGTNENLKNTQNSILALIEELHIRDLELANKLIEVRSLKSNLKTLELIITDPERAIIASRNLALTTSAPNGWTPSQPLILSKPPYPTEDLIRRSSLYQMMNRSATIIVDKETLTEPKADLQSVAPVAPIRSRRRGGPSADSSKLLNLDLNPDL